MNQPGLLDPIEVRVLGALLEKEITTPEYYPLTANSLVAACNQKSNRDPVVNYDEDLVHQALDSLRYKGLAVEITGAGNRVPKYGHRLQDALNLGRREFALLCVLMLRGPQTPGELNSRTDRMYRFSDLEQVIACLDALAERQPHPLAAKLPRVPGTKEARYTHLLSGMPDVTAEAHAAPEHARDRIAAVEAEVAELRDQLVELERQFNLFRGQFQ